eukprot:CAMPEP_0173354960 /NCGR_PEP_ID=MMETSP1144-20121109/17488_1 /TAXON_ID=483371 /ORGANISM="non described non described, Strain CCMP2298" /LENGTH=161 /DNA_ID=CAMNT_0014303593 /DNA_START=295 /DNA_END=776 /DNA_ORIENTATION=+
MGFWDSWTAGLARAAASSHHLLTRRLSGLSGLSGLLEGLLFMSGSESLAPALFVLSILPCLARTSGALGALGRIICVDSLTCCVPSGDQVTNLLHRLLPLRLQHAFREAGGIRYLNDSLCVLIGLCLCLRPSLLLEFAAVSGTRVRYGDTPKHVLEIFAPV